MPGPSPILRPYTTVVIFLGLAAVVLATLLPGPAAFAAGDTAFWLFAACVIAGELLPVRFSSHAGEVSISTTFIFALMLGYGIGPAIVVQVVGSLIADTRSGKPLRRSLFNAAQYALSWGGAGLTLIALGVAGRPALAPADLAAVAAATAVFFVLNAALVRTAVALQARIRIRDHLRRDLAFNAWTTGMLMSLAPAVTAVQQVDLALVAILLLPVVAVHRAATESMRNAKLATHDSLTGLPNRTHFQEQVAGEIARGDGNGVLAVALMDLDRFKEINDTLGHHQGDQLLREVGTRVQAALGGNGQIARLGGDEFAVSLRAADADGAEAAARGVLGALQEPFVIGGIALDVGASLGVALHPDDARDVETLIQRADVAMYRAKESRTGVELYVPSHDHHNLTRLAMASDLRRALEAGTLDVHFQPTIDLATGRVEGAEALVRWNDPERGAVSPAEFVAVAERTGLIGPLTTFVLGVALDRCREWREEGLDLRVAVNLSTHTLLDSGLPEEVEEALRSRGLGPGALLLEITESVLMTDPKRSMAVLRRLSAMGVGLAVDDFGTGYSSLSYLKRLPVDVVKIDRSFVFTMASDPSDAVIVRAIVDLGHSLGLRVVAEGIEDEETLEQLRALGCDVAQGYLIGRPGPAAQVSALATRLGRPAFTLDMAEERPAVPSTVAAQTAGA